MQYNIKKVCNDGKHLRDSNCIHTYLTTKGNRTPQFIWVGYSSTDCELTDITKKGLIVALERDDRFFGENGRYNIQCI